MSAPSDAEVIEELQDIATRAELENERLREDLTFYRQRNRELVNRKEADAVIIQELLGDAINAKQEHTALVAKCHEAHDAHMAEQEWRLLATDLYRVAIDSLRHRYEGLCPDGVDGWDRRDSGCFACNVLTRADRVIGGAA